MKIRLALLCSAMLFAVSSQAQNSDANLEGRVKKLEKEMTAVQRVAFPNGAGKNIQPELTAAEPVKPANTASSSAVSDLLVRVDALEGSLSELTGQVETQAAQQKALETRIKLLEAAVREQAAKTAAAAQPDEEPVKVAVKPDVKPPVKTPVVTTPAKTEAATSASGNAALTGAARKTAVAKVVKPKTADAGEDSYMYGYNLWEAKFYPEAEKQLADTAAKYPNHKRATFARNLMGRAILDDGRASAAVKPLYDNYHNYPKGERAPDSLLYLSVALTRIDQRDEACKCLKELATAYPDVAKGRLAKEVAEGRAAAKCK